MKSLWKRMLTLSIALSFVACSPSGGPAGGTEAAVTGEVMDLMCAQKPEKGGPDHRECALFCVDGRMGPPQPWAIRTSDQKVYKIDSASGAELLAKLRENAGRTAEITGLVTREGAIDSLVAKSVRVLASPPPAH